MHKLPDNPIQSFEAQMRKIEEITRNPAVDKMNKFQNQFNLSKQFSGLTPSNRIPTSLYNAIHYKKPATPFINNPAQVWLDFQKQIKNLSKSTPIFPWIEEFQHIHRLSEQAFPRVTNANLNKEILKLDRLGDQVRRISQMNIQNVNQLEQLQHRFANFLQTSAPLDYGHFSDFVNNLNTTFVPSEEQIKGNETDSDEAQVITNYILETMNTYLESFNAIRTPILKEHIWLILSRLATLIAIYNFIINPVSTIQHKIEEHNEIDVHININISEDNDINISDLDEEKISKILKQELNNTDIE